jgi:hypothetical protein
VNLTISDLNSQTFVTRLERSEKDVFTSFTRQAVAIRHLLQYNGDTDNFMAITEASKVHMAELLVSYRVLDLLAREKGIPGPFTVPTYPKSGHIKFPSKTVSLGNLMMRYR